MVVACCTPDQPSGLEPWLEQYIVVFVLIVRLFTKVLTCRLPITYNFLSVDRVDSLRLAS